MAETASIDVSNDALNSDGTSKKVTTDYKKLALDGLWNNNPALIQLLGLCPLLAVTSNVINGLGLGLATMVTLTLSNSAVSLSRKLVRPEIRIPYYVLVIASIVTMIDLIMHAITPELHGVLGIFIPLIVTNCSIIGRAESFASKNNLAPAAFDGFIMGLGFSIVLIILGGMRELVGSGTLLSDASVMFGSIAENWTMHVVFEGYQGLLLAILPPGAFIGLGFLIALKNIIDKKLKN